MAPKKTGIAIYCFYQNNQKGPPWFENPGGASDEESQLENSRGLGLLQDRLVVLDVRTHHALGPGATGRFRLRSTPKPAV